MKEKIFREIAAKIEGKVKSQYESVHEFHKRSGIGVAYYTIIRFFDPEYEKPPSIATLIEIAHYAGLSTTEINEMLLSIKDHAGNHPFWVRIIGSECEPMTPKERALFDGTRRVCSKDAGMWKQFGATLKLASAATGVDCDKELAVLGV